jgi:hypothetical protein
MLDAGCWRLGFLPGIQHPASSIQHLFRLFMLRMLAAETTILLEFQTLGRLLLIFVGNVVAIFAIAALQYDIVSHNQLSAISRRLSA